jgi:hypothetical protein
VDLLEPVCDSEEKSRKLQLDSNCKKAKCHQGCKSSEVVPFPGRLCCALRFPVSLIPCKQVSRNNLEEKLAVWPNSRSF